MSLYINFSEFLALPMGTGIQRVRERTPPVFAGILACVNNGYFKVCRDANSGGNVRAYVTRLVKALEIA